MEKRNAETYEPRWPGFLAIAAICLFLAALPSYLTVVPPWVFVATVAVLLIPAAITHKRGDHEATHLLGHIVMGVVTAALVASVVLLVLALPGHKEPPRDLLRSAAELWVSNILIFASWYWRLDAGGPHIRELKIGHTQGSFLFPQMTMKDDDLICAGQKDWEPNFIDYLFLAFNTSTALSPADTAILSRWAKMLMMVQATLSLTVVAILAGRAVNIL